MKDQLATSHETVDAIVYRDGRVNVRDRACKLAPGVKPSATEDWWSKTD